MSDLVGHAVRLRGVVTVGAPVLDDCPEFRAAVEGGAADARVFSAGRKGDEGGGLLSCRSPRVVGCDLRALRLNCAR